MEIRVIEDCWTSGSQRAARDQGHRGLLEIRVTEGWWKSGDVEGWWRSGDVEGWWRSGDIQDWWRSGDEKTQVPHHCMLASIQRSTSNELKCLKCDSFNPGMTQQTQKISRHRRQCFRMKQPCLSVCLSVCLSLSVSTSLSLPLSLLSVGGKANVPKSCILSCRNKRNRLGVCVLSFSLRLFPHLNSGI